jgi:SAM-dependent methyltransferase
MDDDQDAYGHAIYDYLDGKNTFEILERDDGYIDASDGPAMYTAAFRQWPTRYKRAMRYVRGHVLDIGCGAGRHALYLQEKGFAVLGIDVSPLAVAACMRRGLVNARVLSVRQVSPALGQFDTLLMLGNNFGLFGSAVGTRRLLRKFYRITYARARIIAESLDPYQTDDPLHLAYQERNRNLGRLPGQVRIRARYRKYATPWFDYLFVSQEELAALLVGTGWIINRVVGSDTASYIAIIEKGGE